MIMMDSVGGQEHTYQYIYTCDLEIIHLVISMNVIIKDMIPCSNFKRLNILESCELLASMGQELVTISSIEYILSTFLQVKNKNLLKLHFIFTSKVHMSFVTMVIQIHHHILQKRLVLVSLHILDNNYF